MTLPSGPRRGRGNRVMSAEWGVVPSNRDPATIDFIWRREEGGVGSEVETVEKGG